MFAQTSGGPDGFGYTWLSSNDTNGPTYSWIQPDTVNATEITGMTDTSTETASIGFDFNFYGVDYNSLTVSSDGLLIFSGSSSLSNQNMPNTSSPNNLIAWYWDDMNPGYAPNETRIFYENITLDGENTFLISFIDFYEYRYGGGGKLTAQVALKQNGEILIQYQSIDDVIDRTSCSIGIENADGTMGLTYCYNDDSVIYDSYAIQFNPPVAGTPFLSTNPSPADNAGGVQTSGTLTWDFGADTDTYDLWFGTTGNMSQVVTGGVSGTTGSYSYSNLTNETTYEWRVDSHNTASGLSTTGDVWTFETVGNPIANFPYTEDLEGGTPPTGWTVIEDNDINSVTISSTRNHTDGGSNSIRFSSYSYASNGEYAQYLISPQVDFSSLTSPAASFWHYHSSSYGDDMLYFGVSTTDTDTTSFTWTNFTDDLLVSWNEAYIDLSAYQGQTVYLAIKYDAPGSDYYIYVDDLKLFNAATPPECTTVVEPADGAVDQLTNVTLSWNSVTGATEYNLYVGETSGNYTVINGTSITESTYDITAVLGQTYYWKVVPENSFGTPASCPEWSFSTFNSTPDCATNFDPADGDTDELENGTLSWDAAFSATEYLLSIGTASGNYNVLDHATITGTSYDYTGLSYSTQYFWQVTPVNGLGPNMTCTEQSFTTRTDPTIVGAWSADFESGIPANWVNLVDEGPEDDNWVHKTTSIGHGATSGNNGSTGYIGFDDSGSSVDNAHIVTNPFDFTSMSNPTLSFWYWIGDSGDTTHDQSTLYIDTFDGSSWTTYGTSWGHTGQWAEVIIDLSVFTSVTTFKLRAEGTSSWYSDVCIDDFVIFDGGNPPTCSTTPDPADGESDQPLSGTLSWSNPGQTEFYVLYLGSATDNYDIVNGMTLTETSYDYSGLTYSTDYFWKVVPGNSFGNATGCPEWSFTTLDDPAITSFPWSEDFEGAMPLGWTIIENNTNNQVTLSNTQNHTTGGTYSLRFSSYSSTSSNDYTQYLISPEINLSSISDPEFSFWHFLYNNTNADDELYFGVSTTGTDTTSFTWTDLTSILSRGNWVSSAFDLSAYEGQTIHIALKYDTAGDDEYYIYVDDASIYSAATPPSCATVASPADAETDVLETGTLVWNEAGNTDYYTLYLGTAADNYDVVNGMTLTATSYAYSGLSFDSSYFWKVVPGNNQGDATGCPEWSFTTRQNPTIVSFPWLEDFTNWEPANWSLSGDRTWGQFNGEVAFCDFWSWNGGTAIMTTPPVQLPSTGLYEVHFDWSHLYDSSYPDDQGIVQVSIDGSNWTELWNLTGTAFNSNDGADDETPGTGVTESFPLDAYLGETVYFQVIGNSDWGPDFFIDNFGVRTYTPPTAKAMVNVYLGGPYSTENNNMDTTVNQYLPVTSPYADAIAVTAMPADVVDWISLELRQTATGATIEQRSALLLDTGMIS